MAAIELPINDGYLSYVHEARIANKAAIRAEAAAVHARRQERLATSEAERKAARKMATVKEEEASRQQRHILDLGADGDDDEASAIGLRASDSAILSHYPTPLLRLLVLLGPTIAAAVQLVRLATWTAGPGTASHSFIIVLAWWAACLYGYEVIRYCPQLALLATLSVTGVVRAFKRTQKPPSDQPGVGEHYPAARPASAETVNATIDNLAVLADFGSTLYATFVVPLVRLLSWHDVEQTLGLSVFLISSWPAWLLLFSGTFAHLWDILHLQAVSQVLYAYAVQPLVLAEPHVRARLAPLFSSFYSKLPAFMRPHVAHGHALLNKIWLFTQLHVYPRLYALGSQLSATSPDVLRLAAGPRFGFFPFLALRVRHLLLVIGTVALTWCSPWCALIRHSLWQSAFVRRAVRFTWSCLSGQIFFGNAQTSSMHEYGRLTLGPNGEPVAFGARIDDAMIFASKGSGETIAGGKGGQITRHEDVVYQFTILENQRWWMGLDWTAALLPQERPSWADESNNPVSPPSSFSLPAPKVTMKLSDGSRNRYVKRMVRWQWIDPEWTVAGRDVISGSLPAAAGSTSGGFFNRRASTTSAVSAMSDSTTGDGRGGAASSNELLSDPSWLDVDAEGWQYGDNGWDKMSKKAGLGRYTRRRRWVRRAVLVELVQSDYVPTPEELSVGQSDEVPAGVNIENGSTGSSAVQASTKATGEGSSLRERPARAASNCGGTAQEISPPQSPSAENKPELEQNS